MDEKTAELRDIFVSVTEEETVTDSQEDNRGSLTDESDTAETRLREGIEQLREKFGFTEDISDEKRCHLIERFYEGDSDEEIASAIDTDAETVFYARMDLHLVRDEEPLLEEGIVEMVREQSDASPAELAESTGADPDEIRRCRAVLDATERSRRVSHRFRTLFEEMMTDVELTGQIVADTQEDGLADATEGAETDVDF